MIAKCWDCVHRHPYRDEFHCDRTVEGCSYKELPEIMGKLKALQTGGKDHFEHTEEKRYVFYTEDPMAVRAMVSAYANYQAGEIFACGRCGTAGTMIFDKTDSPIGGVDDPD